MDVISTTWQGSEGSTGLWMILWRWPVGIGQAQNFSCQLSSTNTCRMYAEMPVIEHSHGSFPWPCEDICEITRGYLPNFVCLSVPPIGSATTSLLMTLTCILKHSAKTFTTRPSCLRLLHNGQKIMKHMFRSPEHHAVEKRKSLCRCSHFRYSPVPSPIDFKQGSFLRICDGWPVLFGLTGRRKNTCAMGTFWQSNMARAGKSPITSYLVL